MVIRESIQKQGSWLFSRRSYIPLALIPTMVLVILYSRDYPQMFATTHGWDLICFFVTIIGMGIRILTVGTSPVGTSGRNTHGQVAESLNTKGIYSVIRHPLYVGNFFVIIGIVLLIGVWWFIFLITALYWLYYERIIFTEEEYLRQKYGEKFLSWAEKTPAVIPSFRNYQPTQIPFSFRVVLAREFTGFLAIAASFAIEDLMEYYLGYRNPNFTFLWTWVFTATLIIYLIIRFLRKKTNILFVEGR